MRVMFAIVMDRSLIICSILLALSATSNCKSIGGNEKNATASTSIMPVPVDSALVPEPSAENFAPKSNLLTLTPSNDETRIHGIEDLDCSYPRNQKTKRCKSLLQKNSQSQLVSLKTPNSMVQPDPAEEHRLAIARSLRQKLQSGDYNLGATPNRSPGGTRIIEDDEYICYCRKKNNPLSRNNGQSRPTLRSRNKPASRPGIKKMLLGESRLRQNPPYLHQPYLSDGLHQYFPSLLPRDMNSIWRYLGGLPYGPYVYQVDPSSLLPDQGQSPTRIRVPISPITGQHDSIVGQQPSAAYPDEQSVGVRCPPNRQRIPAATSKPTKANGEPSGQRKSTENANDNLQSLTNSPTKPENVAKDNSNVVGAAGPWKEHGTGSGTEDYSDVEEEIHSTTEAYSVHSEDDEYTTKGTVGEKTDLERSLNGSTENPLEDDSVGDKNTVTSGPFSQEQSSTEGRLDGNSANKGLANVGQGNSLPHEPLTDTPTENPVNSDPDTLNKNPQVPMANDKHDDDPETSSVDPALMSDIGNINHGVTPEGFFTDFSEDPLKNNQDGLNSDEAEDQEPPTNDSSMNANVTPASRNNENLVNETEIVGAGNPVGIPEQTLPFCDNSLLEKSIKRVINNFATENDGDMGQEMLGSARDDLLKEIVDVPNLKGILSLPAVENTVLDKVKNMLATVTGLPRSKFDGEWPTSVIRNNLHHSLAAAPSAKTELPPNTLEERQFKDGKWVSSWVTLEPTLKSEDEGSDDDERMRASVKSLLKDPAVGLEAARHPVVQNMIVQSVHNTFQNSSNDLIQSVLDSELNLMDLENVETTTADENTGQTQTNDLEDIDINKLLEIARNASGVTESGSTSTQGGLVGSFTDGYEDSTVGTDLPSDITGQKGASLGQEGGGMGEKSKTPTDPNLSTNDAVSTTISTMTESTSNLVGATNNPQITKYPGLSSTSSATPQPSPKTGSPADIRNSVPLNPENLGTWRQESVTKNPCEVSPGRRITDKPSHPEEDLESVFPTTPFTLKEEQVVGMRISEEASSDNAYLGIIPVTKNNYSDDIESLQNSELFYEGDGVKLPLEIRRLSDGSFALSISRKVCEHMLNKYCPCCVPLEGNVVRKVRREPRDEEEAVGKKKISKRESISAGSVDSDHPDSADDSLQISMPVETFARRYNLSLNLQKLQAPWNSAKKTDELEKNGETNFEKRDSGNANLRSLLAVHGVAENGKSEEMGVDDSYERSDDVNSRYRRQKHKKLDKDRYERNIDEKVNKRVEIVTDVLYWLRDMILSVGA